MPAGLLAKRARGGSAFDLPGVHLRMRSTHPWSKRWPRSALIPRRSTPSRSPTSSCVPRMWLSRWGVETLPNLPRDPLPRLGVGRPGGQVARRGPSDTRRTRPTCSGATGRAGDCQALRQPPRRSWTPRASLWGPQLRLKRICHRLTHQQSAGLQLVKQLRPRRHHRIGAIVVTFLCASLVGKRRWRRSSARRRGGSACSVSRRSRAVSISHRLVTAPDPTRRVETQTCR